MSGSVALFVGDISVDLTMTIGHVPAPDEKVHAASVAESPGGVVANAAVACARAGGSSRLLVQIGSDSAGRTATEGVRRTGVDVVAETVDGVTCRVVILVEPHGEKRLLLYPGVSMFASRRQVAKEALAGIGWVHTAVYDTDASVELAARCRANAVPLSLDLEPATFPGSIDDLAAVIGDAEVIFSNRRSTARLGAGAAERLFAMGARAVVLTLGSEGAVLLERGGTSATAPAPAFPIRDTSGAGDCLAGWFIAERLRGTPASPALERAVFAATVSCGRLGTQSSFPTSDEVAALLPKPA